MNLDVPAGLGILLRAGRVLTLAVTLFLERPGLVRRVEILIRCRELSFFPCTSSSLNIRCLFGGT
jgi:hypothetical protein